MQQFLIMWFLSILSILITSFLLYLHWYMTRSRTAKMLNSFPGPPMYPLIGNVLELSRKPDVFFSQVRKILAEYTETFRGWSAWYPTLHVVTADDTEIILSNMKHIEKSLLYIGLHPWLGAGLLTSTGEKWQKRRKFLTPAFHFSILRKFVEIFGEQSDIFIEKLKQQSDESNINIIPLITNFALSSICESTMGIKMDIQDESQTKYYQSVQKVAPYIIQRVLSPWLAPPFIYKLTPYYREFSKLVDSLHQFTKKVIKAREKNFNVSEMPDLQDNTENEDYVFKSNKKRLTMLDLLLQIKQETGDIDDEGIREEMDTFIFEGHDTTSVSTTFTFLLLAHHKEVQTKIIEELNEIFGDSKRQATIKDLQHMKYLERCIKESLRLYPSVSHISRQLNEDVQLTHHIAPAGTMIFLQIYNIHRDPKVFPDPEKFDPDRFLPENCAGRNSYAYIPFSAGPRNCIGQKFAMLELKSIVSTVLRNFTMEPVESIKDLVWLVDLVLRVRGPLHIKFVPRI